MSCLFNQLNGSQNDISSRTRVAAEELGYVGSILLLAMSISIPFLVCGPRARSQLAHVGSSLIVQGKYRTRCNDRNTDPDVLSSQSSILVIIYSRHLMASLLRLLKPFSMYTGPRSRSLFRTMVRVGLCHIKSTLG